MSHTPLTDNSLLLHADDCFEMHLCTYGNDDEFYISVLNLRSKEYVDFHNAHKLKVNFGDYRADRAPYDKHESLAEDLIDAKDFVEDYLTKLPKHTAESIRFLCDDIFDAAGIAEDWHRHFGRRTE